MSVDLAPLCSDIALSANMPFFVFWYLSTKTPDLSLASDRHVMAKRTFGPPDLVHYLVRIRQKTHWTKSKKPGLEISEM